MLRQPKHESAYADTLYRAVDALCRGSRGGFTLVDLHNATGLQITGNMRRRINHCVAAGRLSVTPILLEPRGSCYFYHYPQTPETTQQELPF